ncbi:GNAT family N-acetyltransferase [Actinoallomurus sp. NBC_01490]|jgi:ribosomal protein S18 acetylase RimI-like enzyme|uniref:GNAT family N-acetyltransferase n=1 Tax=Actinoallomurus sp. NBC_01490 TaxID=2903557 RepID=UPI002E32EFC9|nr:GNAT family N-acetyltransferase [Actinoallomurus sp. NBC_01490]
MLSLRPTTMDDLVDLAAWEAEPETAPWLGETGPAWHARALHDPGQEHLVAVRAEAAVGFAVLAGLRDGDAVELRRMVISPPHRRTGLGRSLLTSVLARAYGHHRARRVWLDVKAHNHRARALYESEGFTVTETLTGAVTEADGALTDLVIMAHQVR